MTKLPQLTYAVLITSLAFQAGCSDNDSDGDSVAVSVEPEVSPRPDLAGLRVKLPNQAPIYLIDPLGYRRWIPDPTTYNNLFRDWNGIVTEIGINEIARGADLTSGAVLAKGSNSAPVYLVSNGVKSWITSPAAMDKYYFNWNRVYVVPDILIDYVPSGSNWN